MRVLQVLTFVSTDGAYGGPVAVARMQCEYLARRGHEVHLVAGWDGEAKFEVPGVAVHLYRAHRVPRLRFAGLWSASLWWKVRRLSATADVVHLHFARDLIQLPLAAALRRHTGLVLQPHGMIRPDRRGLARVLDLVGTRPAYRSAAAHLVLTETERADVAVVEPRARGDVVAIKNAVPEQSVRARWAEKRPRVVFISRLHPRKRPTTFVDMAAAAIRLGSDADFALYGSDEGELHLVQKRIAEHGLSGRVSYGGTVAPNDVVGLMAGAQVFVLPSVNEPFPMALLEAMSVGLPPVITDSTGISDELRQRGAAAVTDGSPEQLAAAVLALTASEERWEAAAQAARDDIARSFSCEAVVDTLEKVYSRLNA